MRECYALWCEARKSTWVRRNDLIDLLDQWYSAAAEPFSRGSFDADTDLYFLVSGVSELGWVREYKNSHVGQSFHARTMLFADAFNTSGDAATWWDDIVLTGDHRLTCDFFDFFVELILPLGRANGQVREWAKGCLWIDGLTVGQKYRNVFKNAGGATINRCLMAQMESPHSFDRVTQDPLGEVDRERVLVFFAEKALEKVSQLRLTPINGRFFDAELDLLEARIHGTLPGLTTPEPSQFLTPRMIENLEVKWVAHGTIPLADLCVNDEALKIAGSAIHAHNRHLRSGATRIKDTPSARLRVLEGVLLLVRHDVAHRLGWAGGDDEASSKLSAESLRHLAGQWLSQEQDLDMIRNTTTWDDVREPGVGDFSEGLVDRVDAVRQMPLVPRERAKDEMSEMADPDDQTDLIRAIVHVLSCQLAGLGDTDGIPQRVMILTLERHLRTSAPLAQLLIAALMDVRRDMEAIVAQAEIDGDDDRRLAALAAIEQCTQESADAALREAAKIAAAHEAQRQMDEDNPASDEDDSPGSPNGQAKDR